MKTIIEFLRKLFRRSIVIRMDAIEQEGMWQQRYQFKEAECKCLQQVIDRLSYLLESHEKRSD